MFLAVAVALGWSLLPLSEGDLGLRSLRNPRYFEPVIKDGFSRTPEEQLASFTRREEIVKKDITAIEQGILWFEQMGGDPAKLPALYAQLEKARRRLAECEDEYNKFLETMKK